MAKDPDSTRSKIITIGQDPVSVAYHPRGLVSTGRGKARPLGLPRGYLGDWIGIFGGLSVEEMHVFIDRIMVSGARWTYESLATLRAELCGASRFRKALRRTTTVLGQDAKPSDHHLLAVSRGGVRRGNVVRLPRGFHTQWHQVFANLTPVEARTFLTEILVSGTRWTYESLRARQIAIMRQTAAAKRRAHQNPS